MKAFEQIFKNITLVVPVATNDGPIDETHVAYKANVYETAHIRVKNDCKYSPIHADGTLATDGTKYIVGVLRESFVQKGKSHSVMLHGIIPMQCSEAIKPGDLVTAAAAKTGATENTKRTRIKKAVTADHYFGIALQKASAEGDFISVLVGTMGGKLA